MRGSRVCRWKVNVTQINYIKGDATAPIGDDNRIIAHVCNDIGGWGRGFVLALSRRWPEPEKAFRDWYAAQNNFALGETQIVQVEPSLFVANMIGQRDIKRKSTPQGALPPIRYDAIRNCLAQLAIEARSRNASVHMPRIGCGLAGGKWENIEPLINETLLTEKIPVFVYDFE